MTVIKHARSEFGRQNLPDTLLSRPVVDCSVRMVAHFPKQRCFAVYFIDRFAAPEGGTSSESSALLKIVCNTDLHCVFYASLEP